MSYNWFKIFVCSDVLAAYARFLWEIDENEEKDEATTFGVGVNDLERYYKTMVNESCCDPLLLTNYARFLQQVYKISILLDKLYL